MTRLRALTRLTPADADRLREVPFTYPEVGATLRGEVPQGYGRVDATARVGPADRFDSLAEQVLGFEVQRRSGLRVRSSGVRAEPGTAVVMLLGIGPLALRVPCRVVDVIDEPDRRGFAYGTLPGHPETGEELFVLERRADGVHLVVQAFSRPATLAARLGGPIGNLGQAVMTRRYLRALIRDSSEPD